MMTLEEAIKRYSSNAFYEKSDGNLQGYLEFNQLAEWLKDYKRLLEQKPILDKIKAEIIKKHLSIIEKNDFDNGRTYGYEEVLEIIDKYRGKENADSN